MKKLTAVFLSLLLGCATAGADVVAADAPVPGPGAAVETRIAPSPRELLPTGDNFYVPRISFEGEVDALSVLAASSLIDAVVAAGASAIVLEINTPGGDVWEGFKLAKAIEGSKIPVICIVDGEAASMGFYLLQSCSTRIMTRRSNLMAHQPAMYGQVGGPEVAWRNIAESLRVLSRGMVEHMARRMKVTADAMEARIANGTMWWMDWREGLSSGAVDKVIDDVPGYMARFRQTLVP